MKIENSSVNFKLEPHTQLIQVEIKRICRIDRFFSGKNGASLYLGCSNDSSFQAKTNDTHIDGCFKIIGSLPRGQR